MTYNLHQGFNTEGILNVEELAQVIESEQPDIVALQEVTRGWVINSSLDMLPWLSRRLGLPYIWGPTDPPQWGNAILSKYPILNSEVVSLSPEDLSLRRGFIDATIQIKQIPIRILATHFHHPVDGSPVRHVQAEELIIRWAGSAHTVILGDLNATIGSPEMTVLAEAGLIETLRMLTSDPPGTFHSENPTDQIDYIWVTSDLVPISYAVPGTTASDHLPVVVDLEIKNP
jgi:endonuclease/exonuclease/phosphatase family metal-dependent hydrolase